MTTLLLSTLMTMGIAMIKDTQPVYKVLTNAQWQQLETDGTFAGSEHDLRDGFIHLSTQSQLNYVINKYFKGTRPLHIIEFRQESFLEKLVWESNSQGELFPHLYGEPLRLELVSAHKFNGQDSR